MKKWILLLLSISSSLCADIWDDSVFYLENNPPPLYPFSISGDYIDVSKAHFRTPGWEDRSLIYRQWDTAFSYTHPFNPICGLIFGAGWVGTEVNMQDNPDFNETLYNYVNFSIGGFTKAFPDWTWTLTLSAFFDTEEFSLIDYTLYQGVLWGRYSFCKYLEFDFGLITEIGLKKEKVWPILGFVYTPYDCLRLFAIYPVQISLEYDFLKCMSLAASVRFLRNRHRLQQEEPNSQGIFEYHTTGAELDLIYRPFKWATLKGFTGSTFNGDLQISDRNDRNTTHYKFKGSFYWGATAIISF